MSRAALDLSSRPFVNRRPVFRLSMLLWLAGGLLLAGNVWLYWDFIAGRGNLHAQLRDVNEKIEIEERRISALSNELASFDLAAQNQQVVYLNQRIGQRRFSWSRLFDELSDLLPRDVRLTSLAPSTQDDDRTQRASSSAVSGDGVLLEIDAQARNDQAILDFVDALFADPSFERPNLSQQRQEQGEGILFNLGVYYAPERAMDARVLDATEDVGGDRAPGESEGDGEAEEADAADPSAVAPAPSRGHDSRPTALGRPASSPPEIS
jgi:Tfp pilus assembly protein PilN